MNDIKVTVLCEGRIVRSGKAILEAHSSVTMVTWPEHIMIVDTSDGDYRPQTDRCPAPPTRSTRTRWTSW